MYARSALESIRLFHDELTALRRDLHAHPELGFEEVRTSGIVAGALEALGIEVHRGIGKTGVVGVIRGKRCDSGRMIGLRADMDALPMTEDLSLIHISMKDVVACEKLRGAGKQALIRRCPNGETHSVRSIPD